jgi:hypothetical protein
MSKISPNTKPMLEGSVNSTLSLIVLVSFKKKTAHWVGYTMFVIYYVLLAPIFIFVFC